MAIGQPSPCSITARAPNTKPPSWENGSRLIEESRTIRPQMNRPVRRTPRPRAIASQANPSGRNTSICQAQMIVNPPQPTDSTVRTTRPNPKLPTSRVPSSRPDSASAIESFFKPGQQGETRKARGSAPHPARGRCPLDSRQGHRPWNPLPGLGVGVGAYGAVGESEVGTHPHTQPKRMDCKGTAFAGVPREPWGQSPWRCVGRSPALFFVSPARLYTGSGAPRYRRSRRCSKPHHSH